jgi:predicted small lipoprotein YifL
VSNRLTCKPAVTLGRRPLLVLLGLCAAGAVGACGKKGPLRLPEPAASDAPSSDEEVE